MAVLRKLVVAATLFVGQACSHPASEGTTPLPPSPGKIATASVGAEGGEFKLPLGEGELVIQVPAGALRSSRQLTAALRLEAIPGAVSRVVELGPTGTTFETPVKLKFRPRGHDLTTSLNLRQLRVATRVADQWQVLPTEAGTTGELVGTTSHFSPFALVAPCSAAGLGTDFQLVGCPTFDARIQSSIPVELNATAGSVSLRIITAASAAGGVAQFTISGLAASTPYFLHRDGSVNAAIVTTDLGGTLQFPIDLSAQHLLMLSVRTGSIALSAMTCTAPFGEYDISTATCALVADVPDGDVSIIEAGLTLNCEDPHTQVRHQIGSAAARISVGVVVNATANVRVKNCDFVATDFGIELVSADGFDAEALTFDGVPGLFQVSAGAVDITGGSTTLSNATITGFSVGVTASAPNALTATGVDVATLLLPSPATHLVPPTPGHAAVVVGGGAVQLQAWTVDGTATLGAQLPSDIGAIFIEQMEQALVSASVTGVSQYADAIWITDVPDGGVVSIDGTSVSGGPVGLRIDAPSSTITNSTFSANGVGLQLSAGSHTVFHNNFESNTLAQIVATQLEVSDPATHEGNYWGRVCPAPLFVPGVDSNDATVVDSYPFAMPDAWLAGARPGCAIPAPTITSPTDGALVTNPQPQISGTAVAGGSVQVESDGVVVATAVATGVGDFTAAPALPLTEGAHDLMAVVSTDAGTSAPSAPVHVTIDTAPPAPPQILFPPQGAALIATEVVFFGKAEPLSNVTISEGAQTVATGVALSDGTFSVFPVQQLASGAHLVAASARDAAGNMSSTSAITSFTVSPVDAADPILGAGGKLTITSVSDSPNPALIGGPSNLLTVVGTVSATNGLNGNGQHTFSVAVQRSFSSVLTGQPVVTTTSSSTVPQHTGASNVAFSTSDVWDGRDSVGSVVPPGTYLALTQVAFLRTIPGNPGSCSNPFGGTPSPCVIDITRSFVTSVTWLGVQAISPCQMKPEICNGVDDNCNGQIDEGSVCNVPGLCSQYDAQGACTPRLGNDFSDCGTNDGCGGFITAFAPGEPCP